MPYWRYPFLGPFNNFICHRHIGLAALGILVKVQNGHTESGRFAEANIAQDCGGKGNRSVTVFKIFNVELFLLYKYDVEEGKDTNKQECKLFFDDVCTIQELDSIAQRLEVARLLTEGKSYAEINQLTKASTATICRVSKCVNYGEGGYKTALDRIGE